MIWIDWFGLKKDFWLRLDVDLIDKIYDGSTNDVSINQMVWMI